MAAEIQKGLAHIHGMTGVSGITMTGYASFTLDSAPLEHIFDVEEIKDANKFDAALVATNGHKELDLTWTPTAATKSAAKALAVFLEPLACVTLAGFDVTAYNGAWIYIGNGKIDLNTGPAKQSMKIRKYDDATQNASLVTTVS